MLKLKNREIASASMYLVLFEEYFEFDLRKNYRKFRENAHVYLDPYEEFNTIFDRFTKKEFDISFRETQMSILHFSFFCQLPLKSSTSKNIKVPTLTAEVSCSN